MGAMIKLPVRRVSTNAVLATNETSTHQPDTDIGGHFLLHGGSGATSWFGIRVDGVSGCGAPTVATQLRENRHMSAAGLGFGQPCVESIPPIIVVEGLADQCDGACVFHA